MKVTQTKRYRHSSLCALAALLLLPGFAKAADDWEFGAEIYAWLPNIDIEDENGSSTEITLDDILDNLDFTAMFTASARKGKWSLRNDLIYMDLSDKPGDAITSRLTLRKVEMEAWIVSPTVGYTVFKNEKSSIDLYAGARYLDLELDTSFEFRLPGNLPERRPGIDGSDSFTDGIVGVRGNYRLSDNWYLPFAIDAGTGQSDSTYQATAAAAYKFKKFDAIFGWRYLTWNFGKEVDQISINGPYAGVIFQF